MNNNNLKILSKFMKYIFPYRRRQIAILALSVTSMLLGLVNPYLSKLIVDNAIINKEMKTFVVLGLTGGMIFILSGILNSIISFLERGIRLKVSFDLNKNIFNQVQRLSLDFFKDKSMGENMFKINYDVDRAADLIVFVPKELVSVLPKLFLILGIIFYLDWQMAVFALALVPILYLPVYYFTGRMRKILEEIIMNSQNIFKHLGEFFSHVYLIKAFGKESAETRKYLKSLILNIRISLKNARFEISGNFIGGSFERIIIGLIALFGGYQVIRGRISAGTLAAIMIYLTQLISLQNNMALFFQRVSFGLISCNRLNEIMEEKIKVMNSVPGKRITFDEPKIEFKDVSFGYSSGQYVFNNLSFSTQGGVIALSGPSGCGKTTLLNLILRLSDPWEGNILVEGNNLKELDLFSLRNQIGISLQEPFLWNDTIENNIKYPVSRATLAEIMEAAQWAGVDGFVKDLPYGYSTIIGENACKLSEGQKQRIAIARALIKKPRILILDEAMSSIDSAGEEKIIAELRKVPQIHTIIIVAHRLSTVLACDLVYFLKDKGTVAIETPEKLMKNDVSFYNLFSAQLQGKNGNPG